MQTESASPIYTRKTNKQTKNYPFIYFQIHTYTHTTIYKKINTFSRIDPDWMRNEVGKAGSSRPFRISGIKYTDIKKVQLTYTCEDFWLEIHIFLNTYIIYWYNFHIDQRMIDNILVFKWNFRLILTVQFNIKFIKKI